MPDAQELLDLATELAVETGHLVRRGRAAARSDVATKSTPTDVVTAMDRAAEAHLSDALNTRRPADGLYGEEGSSRSGSSGVRWVVDPIDGTVNYLYGLPWYAVSVAATVDDVVVAGAVFQPETGELFRARRGAGAWLGEQRLTCTAGPSLSQALVSTGFGYAAERRREQAAVAAAVLPIVRDLRRLGSSALDLCQVAAGRVDGYYEAGLNAWDHAAAALIAQEAGATVRWLGGGPVTPDRRVTTAPDPAPGCLVAAGPDLVDALHDLLLDLGAPPQPSGEPVPD